MKTEPIHFLGIGGIGVSALAQVAQARGIAVSGSDPHADPETNPAVKRLLAGGAAIYREHRAENITEATRLVVASAAIAESNPEILRARELGIRVVSRAEFLGELMAAHPGPKIAVAGTHGKTTTTAMLGVLLQEAGLEPTVFVGGEVAQLGGNVRIGSESGPFVAEACEAYDSFHHLKPDIVVLTNVEADHLDHYGTYENVLASFQRFLSGVRSGGKVIVCGDDAGVRDLFNLASSHSEGTNTTGFRFQELDVLDYGMEDRRYSGSKAKHVRLEGCPSFEWHCEVPFVPVRLNVPGRHNIYNALAAATVAHQLGVPGTQVARGLEAFRGAGRRQEVIGEIAGQGISVLVMDDYAHHPTEIRATLSALRTAYPDRELTAIFQPHLYSRTRDFLSDFADALSLADRLIVTDIYAAREQPIAGVNAADIVERALRHKPDLPAQFVADKRNIPEALFARISKESRTDAKELLTVFIGAGDIREQGEAFVELWKRKEKEAKG